jgi:Acetoacetate decarboxylase (ADC)
MNAIAPDSWYNMETGGADTDQICSKVDDNHYKIDGQDIDLPVVVRKARNAFATFIVPAKAAQAWIAKSGFEVVEIWPGKAIMQVVGVEYFDNDLGDYHEAGFSFYVRQPGSKKGLPLIGGLMDIIRGRAASYIHLLPVNQDFTMHAGRFIWGYPKWNTEVEITEENNELVTRFSDQGKHVFTLRSALGGNTKIEGQKQLSVAVRNGIAYKTLGVANGTGAKFGLGGKPIELGDHPIADELRKLGLPKKPFFSGTLGNFSLEVGGPVSAPVGEPFPE